MNVALHNLKADALNRVRAKEALVSASEVALKIAQAEAFLARDVLHSIEKQEAEEKKRLEIGQVDKTGQGVETSNTF